MFFNICTLINNARNYQFQIQPNTNLYPYICYEGQKVDTILNGGVVWTRPVYKSEINIDGWAKLTGMVASDGLWRPPPAWGCLGWPPYSLHPIESEWWPHLLTGSHYKPKQETFISIRSPTGRSLSSIQTHTWVWQMN